MGGTIIKTRRPVATGIHLVDMTNGEPTPARPPPRSAPANLPPPPRSWASSRHASWACPNRQVVHDIPRPAQARRRDPAAIRARLALRSVSDRCPPRPTSPSPASPRTPRFRRQAHQDRPSPRRPLLPQGASFTIFATHLRMNFTPNFLHRRQRHGSSASCKPLNCYASQFAGKQRLMSPKWSSPITAYFGHSHRHRPTPNPFLHPRDGWASAGLDH